MTAATMRHDAAGKIRRLANEVQETHPTMGAHNHLRDAARALDSGNTEAAQRHLRAATGLFTPQNLIRHGHLTDDVHMAGKQHMHSAHRMILLVKDAEDRSQQEEQKRVMNAPQHLGVGRSDRAAEGPSAPIGQAPYKKLPARSWIAEGVQSAGPKLLANGPEPYRREPDETVTCPNCGKGDAPDAKFCDQCGHRLTPSEPYRQLGEEDITCPFCGKGDSSDARYCDQCGRKLPATAYRDLSQAIELVGPKGYVHGWHFVGVPGSPGSYRSLVHHPQMEKLGAQDRQVVTTHIGRAAAAASLGDHNTAEMELRTARARAYNRGAHSLVSAIGVVRDYHHAQATQFLPKNPPAIPSYADWLRQTRAAASQEMKAHTPTHLRTTPVPYILSNTTDLSARTAMLERTPAPRGRPGGPGLYDVSGMGHTDYLQQIVKALIEKRGMEPSKAYAIARGAIRRWMRGGGHVHPEVRAAASAAEAGELARQARAKAAHGHSNAGQPGVIELFNPYHSPTGQFTTAQNAQQGKKGKKPGKARGFLPQHGAGQRARAKGQLLAKARQDEQKANALRAQLRALLQSLRGSGGSGKTRAAGGTSKSSASSSKAAAGKTSTSGASGKSGPPSSSRTASRSAMQAKAQQLRAQIHGLEQQARQLRAQAAKL